MEKQKMGYMFNLTLASKLLTCVFFVKQSNQGSYLRFSSASVYQLTLRTSFSSTAIPIFFQLEGNFFDCLLLLKVASLSICLFLVTLLLLKLYQQL